MHERESDAEAAAARLRSAIRICYLLAVMKVIAFAWGLRLLFDPAAGTLLPGGSAGGLVVAVVIWELIAFNLCVIIARGLSHRRGWARRLGMLFGLYHLVGVVAIRWLGPVVLLNAVIGAVMVATIHIAGELGAFAVASPQSSDEVSAESRS